MAESYDRKTPSSYTDDMIKETLKSGLSNIKASDNLIKITLEKCQAEVEKRQKKKLGKFMTMTYKLGAPLAAGALVLVLVLNSSGLFSTKMNSGMSTAPQAPAPSAAPAPAEETGLNNINNTEITSSFDSSAGEPVAESPKIMEQGAKKAEEESDGLAMMRSDSNQAILNSRANRSANNLEPALDESVNYFMVITYQYNLNNGTSLSLVKDGITRIYTLPERGVDPETLLSAKDYHEILSGEGYWALPLKNQKGIIDTVLTVASIDADDAEIPVSDRDAVYSAEGKDFIVSSLENSSIIGSELSELFDKNAITGLIKKSGYEYDNNSERIIADINYGTDFIVLSQAKNQTLVVPLMINENLFGVVNRKVYTWPEFVRTISFQLGQ